ncbi:transporter [Lacinutrix jangbogonensis]|uniref:transporter n=1 Tax=Lacinutrix jangbogonensis TaxID=1469557 RepID=UPI00053EFAC3|nr:transporter [Lacinutrix jangbogonensis]
MKYFISIVITCFVIHTSLAQGDGTRAYWPVPAGTNMVTPLYFHINSNAAFNNPLVVAEAEFETNLYGAMYTRVFNLAGRSAAVIAMVSGGTLNGEISGLIEGETSGMADTYVIGLVNLYGAPSVDLETYMQTKYNFAADVIVAFRAPTGSYDADRILNIGTNRWEFKLGFPMMKFFNWGTNKVISIELVPTLSLFTDNTDISGTNASLEQTALFNLEGHVTRKFSKLIWGSFDYLYRNGGRTSLGGVNNNDLINALQIGGTVGFDINPKIATYVTYGGIVAQNTNGLDGDFLKLSFSYNW